jgi:3-oxoacyl-[acyl-carrier-protein] synthase II
MAAVITGIGACSPLGCSFSESLETLREGRPPIDDIRNFPVDGCPYTAAGEIRRNGEVVRTPVGVDRKMHFLELALKELSSESAFKERYTPGQLMLNLGIGIDYFELETCMESEKISLDILLSNGLYHNIAPEMKELVSRWQFGAGYHLFASACTASAHAIGLSWRLLRRGLAEAIVTGGSDSMIFPGAYLGFGALGALSASDEPAPVKCHPCDLNSNGTVLGEASVVMLLEDSSRASGTPLAEIIGYGSSTDAYSVTDPEPSGEAAAWAVKEALDEAGLKPEQIDCIHLHGTGTVKCAPAEYNCLYRIFGERLKEIPAYSMKGQVGHMIGSCTALEVLGVVYSLQNQVVLPTVNFCTPHPEAPFRMVTGSPLHTPIRHILKINSAFGGHNTALVFKRWEK